jgi:hypothetical protein
MVNCVPVSDVAQHDDLKDAHYKWVDSAMQTDNSDKENNRKHIFME